MTNPYAFFLLAGLAVLALGIPLAARWGGLPWPRALWPGWLALLAAVAGARLLNLLIDTNPGLAPVTTHFNIGSFTLYGGALPAVLTAALACRLLKLPVRRYLDLAAPVAGLGIAAARIGCALNGCCFGLPTILPWGIVPPYGGAAHQMQLEAGWVGRFLGVPLGPLPIHPTQIYELAAALAAGSIALWLLHRRAKPGVPTAAFGLVFSSLRLLIFQVRAFPGASELSLLIRGPLIHGAAIVLALLLLVYSWRKRRNDLETNQLYHKTR